MRFARAASVVGLVLPAAVALALPMDVATLRRAYKIPAGSALDKAACVACHKTAAGGALNPYGADAKKALAAAKTKKLTPEILKKLDRLDSDKDKVTNAKELAKGTLPGDPKSK
jgi:hypothetical protein